MLAFYVGQHDNCQTGLMWAQTVCHFFLFLFTFKVSHNGRLLNENGWRLCLSPFLKKHMLQLGGCWTDVVWCKERERNVWCECKECTALSRYWCYVGAVHSVQRVTGVFNMLCDTVLIGGSWHKSFVTTNICRDKSFVVAKKYGSSAKKMMFVARKYFCVCHNESFVTAKTFSHNKHIFVMTKLLLRQAYFCCNERCVLSWQTRVCCNKTFFHNKNDTCGSSHQWQLMWFHCVAITFA